MEADQKRPRRPKGTGSVRERSKGRWQLRMYAGSDPVTGKPRLVERTVDAPNKTKAQEKLREELAKLEASSALGTSATVRVICEEWLRHKAGRSHEPKTIHEDGRCIENIICPELGDVPGRELTSRHIDEWQLHLLTGEGRLFATPEKEATARRGGRVPKLKDGSVRRHFAVLSAALGKAVDWGWLEQNPCERLTAPPANDRDQPSPNADQVTSLIRRAIEKNPRWAMLLIMAIISGARRGEVAALRWTDVEPFDQDGETWAIITFRRSVWRAGKERGVKDTLKGGGKGKLVTVEPIVVAYLEQWRLQCQDWAAEADVALVPDAFIVSPFSDGSRPVNADSFGSAIRRWCRDLGMPEIHLHSQRHHAASALIKAGIDVRATSEILGHRDGGRLLLKTYAHGDAATHQAAARVLGRPLAALNPVPQ